MTTYTLNKHTHTHIHTPHIYTHPHHTHPHTRKKPQNSCRRHVGNGGDLGGKRKKLQAKERVGPVAANPDNLENNKEAEGGAQGTQGLK